MSEDRTPGDAFRALANMDRRDILRTLLRAAQESHQLCIAQIADRVELSRFAAARHLRILEESGLVTSRRDRLTVIFTLRLDGLNDVDDWVGSFFTTSDAGALPA